MSMNDLDDVRATSHNIAKSSPMQDARSIEAFTSFCTTLHGDIQNLSLRHICSLEDSLFEITLFIKHEHNKRISINRLPPELLIHIFHHVRTSYCLRDPHTDMYISTGPPNYRSLIKATHVCRWWRTTAISCCSLWDFLPAVTADVMEALLGRSGTNPIRVHTGPTGFWLPLFCRAPYKDRVEEMVTSAAGELAFGRVLPHLAPTLKYLEAQAPDSGRDSEGDVLTEANIFGNQTPRALKALTFSLGTRVLPTDLFPQLAHLRITGGKSMSLVCSRLLRLLSNTPRVETLSVILIALTDDVAVDHRRVSLGHLRGLVLDHPGVRGASAMMKHLCFPSDAIVQLLDLEIPSDSAQFTLYLPPQTELSSLEVVSEWSEGYHIRARGPHGGGIWLSAYFDCTRKRLRPSFDMRIRVLTSILRQLGPALSGVTTLRVAGAWEFDYKRRRSVALEELAMLLTLSDLLPAVSTLVVACSNEDFSRRLPSDAYLYYGRQGLDDDDADQPEVDACTTAALVAALSPPAPYPSSTPHSRRIPFRDLDTLAIQVSYPHLGHADLAAAISQRVALSGRPMRAFTLSVDEGGGDREGELGAALAVLYEGAAVERAAVTDKVVWDPHNDGFWRTRNQFWALHLGACSNIRPVGRTWL
ncbi:hypothetical protein C8Q76DRAFT_746781 [Earliella scabrosa]|nr:hypothetical protein C8Q76DRAFT_746781 [Earliella scabrosa]